MPLLPCTSSCDTSSLIEASSISAPSRRKLSTLRLRVRLSSSSTTSSSTRMISSLSKKPGSTICSSSSCLTTGDFGADEILNSKYANAGLYCLDVDKAVEVIESIGSNNAQGEIYLTDAITKVAKESGAVACVFEGRRYDIGNKQGYLEAVVDFALRDENLAKDFKEYLKTKV